MYLIQNVGGWNPLARTFPRRVFNDITGGTSDKDQQHVNIEKPIDIYYNGLEIHMHNAPYGYVRLI